jgi:hypothetical protein
MSKFTGAPEVDEPDDVVDEELNAAIEEAIAQADRGEGIPWEVVRKEIFGK